MLVQQRQEDRLRLFRQHDHALLSGELASAWTGLGREPSPLGFPLVLAVALHDLSWRDLDEVPRFDAATGLPCPFYDHPAEERLGAYRAGLDEVARIHPYAALLGSLHYSSFPVAGSDERFLAREADRRRQLRDALGLGPEDEPSLARDLRYLQFFDNFSLFVCLTSPGVVDGSPPRWVEECRHQESPAGDGVVHLTWVENDVLHVDPFPFRGAFEIRVPYRELDGGPYPNAAALRQAWERSVDGTWWVEVRPAPRLA